MSLRSGRTWGKKKSLPRSHRRLWPAGAIRRVSSCTSKTRRLRSSKVVRGFGLVVEIQLQNQSFTLFSGVIFSMPFPLRVFGLGGVLGFFSVVRPPAPVCRGVELQYGQVSCKNHYGITPTSFLSNNKKIFACFCLNSIFYSLCLTFQGFIGCFKLLLQRWAPEYACNLSRISRSIHSHAIFLGSWLKVSSAGTVEHHKSLARLGVLCAVTLPALHPASSCSVHGKSVSANASGGQSSLRN